MTRTILDVHILQTVPPSNLNRDDTGSPKSAVYGGVRRARVSSQAWKRAARLAFRDTLDTSMLGVRTRRVVDLVAQEVTRQESSLEAVAAQLAAEVLKAAGIKVSAPRRGRSDESEYLLFLSRRQVQQLAQAGIAAARTLGPTDATLEVLDKRVGEALDKKAIKALIKSQNSIDLALFGRMVADAADLNVDAAAQVAHAISVHGVENEYDYFTAVDDHKQETANEDAGAGMIGTVEFNSATFYRYTTLDVDRLHDNLGDPAATAAAVKTYLRAFTLSMPGGKQTTFANRTLPDAVLVCLRDDQPVSFVGAFEEPVHGTQRGGRVAEAAEALARYVGDLQDAFGRAPQASWVVTVGEQTAPLAALGDRLPFDALVDGVVEAVSSRVGVPS